ncbi:hypothetical protein [Agriterribacter sp.]|uniref:hypothetical protein n=1 Tax=Agriterribacter sp. TaxID=2821509 RepID=UPI002CF67ADE|nr:hypothetical protein [Agriterribacter sp.]HRP57136.1 hypothetical protein [Agriterribacter sp.]
MKVLLFLSLIFCSLVSFAQSGGNKNESGKILVDNDKVKVVEFVASPKANVCGRGMHFHEPHLTVALTDAKVLITTPDGKKQEAQIPANAALWFDAGTHTAINTGDAETKLLLVYLKEQ